MIPIKPALSYFRDCYRLDTRTTQLDNFFGRKVEQRYLFEGNWKLDQEHCEKALLDFIRKED